MGSLIRTTAEGIVDAAGQPVFDIVAQIGFDLTELESAPAADVIIDFSNVVTFDAVVAYVERTDAAVVSGTTGYSPEQMDRLRELGQSARVMHSGNYSIGIAPLRHLRPRPRANCPAADCRDAPQPKGRAPAALLLLDAVVEANPGGRLSLPSMVARACAGARDPKEIGMHSLRGGNRRRRARGEFLWPGRGGHARASRHEPSDLCQRRAGRRAKARHPRARS